MQGRGLITVTFVNPTTTEEANSVFSVLVSSCQSPLHIGVSWKHYDNATADVFARYLRDPSSSLQILSMHWLEEEFPVKIFNSTCDEMAESLTLKVLGLGNVPVTGHNAASRATESLANAIVKSSSLERIRIGSKNSGNLTIDQVCGVLSQTAAVKNLDLCFRKVSLVGAQYRTILDIFRSNPCKSILSKNIPLGLWSHILARADNWKEEDSHTSLDFLLYFTREKNDVLLQNVRKRRIRKRKLFQIS